MSQKPPVIEPQSASTTPKELPPELREYLNSSETTAKISARYGISPAALTMRAKRAGLSLRKRGRRCLAEPSPEQKMIIALARKKGCQHAASKFGVSKQWVSRLVRRWDVFVIVPPRRTEEPPRKVKGHVMSFRIDGECLGQLSRLLRYPSFSHLRSLNHCAREIVHIFLSERFSSLK